MERTEKEQLTSIPEFNYHVETTLSMSSAFMLNDLTLNGQENHELYKHYVPDLMIRALFIKGGRYTRFGLEGGVSYISVPTIKTKGVLSKVGIANGTMRNIGGNFILNRGASIGYIFATNNKKQPTNIRGISHGVYLSDNTSLLYKTNYNTAIGLNFSLNLYHLWDWHYSKGKPENVGDSKPGFGIYPTLGISYYFGGL